MKSKSNRSKIRLVKNELYLLNGDGPLKFIDRNNNELWFKDSGKNIWKFKEPVLSKLTKYVDPLKVVKFKNNLVTDHTRKNNLKYTTDRKITKFVEPTSSDEEDDEIYSKQVNKQYVKENETVKFLNSGVDSCIFLMPSNEIWRLSMKINFNYNDVFNEVAVTTKLRAMDPQQIRFFSFDNFWHTKCSAIKHVLGEQLYTNFLKAISKNCQSFESEYKSCSKTNPNAMVYISKSKKILKPIHSNYKHPKITDLNISQRKYLTESINLLHSNNIFHNDLHLNNVMLGANNKPIIIDWGFATIVPKEKQTSQLLLKDFLPSGLHLQNAADSK